MQFASLEYAVFFPLAVLLYYAAPARHRWAVLVATSAIFIAWAGVVHLAIALGLAVVNYFVGIAMEKHADTRRASWLLFLVLFCNLGALGLFKYAGAFTASLHGAATPGQKSLFLPLGISYYVFQLVSYDLEIYWGRAHATDHLGHLVASVLFFPKLLAGPIERPHHFMPQLAATKPFEAENIISGLKQLGWGLFKKCVIADRIALVIAPIEHNPHGFSGLPLLLTFALFPVQAYTDFSGYTDMALGSARVLGLEIVPNFNHPFSARSVTDFWRRWHMSLSSWTVDYIFRPLSTYVSFKTRWHKTGLTFSIIAAFLVLGAWHGPSWNFVLFGLMHGLAVSLETVTQRSRSRVLARLPERLADRLSNAVTVVFYTCSCVVFRADSVSDAGYMLGHAFAGIGHVMSAFADQRYHLLVLLLLAILYGAVHRASRHTPISEWLSAQSTWLRWSVYYAVIAGIVIFGLFGVKEFEYVQF